MCIAIPVFGGACTSTTSGAIQSPAGLGLEYGDVPAGGIVAGVGKIHGVDTMVVANDGTVKGGTFYPITITKQLRLQVSASVSLMLCSTR